MGKEKLDGKISFTTEKTKGTIPTDKSPRATRRRIKKVMKRMFGNAVRFSK